ncbi:MAG: DUF1080 domain-containing protein [Gemmatimonadales bacterium]|nr:DUF1080 domain-containing protein [Gemmatimonadales bacterium]
MRKLVFLPLFALALACSDSTLVEPAGDQEVAAAKDGAMKKVLFLDDFEDGDSDGWDLWGDGWSIEAENGNHVLSSSTGSHFAIATLQHAGWYNFSFKSAVKFVSGETYCELLLRIDDLGQHYWVQIAENGVALHKEGATGAFEELARHDMDIVQSAWYDFEIVAKNKKIKVYVDGSLKINVKDDDPWGNIGTIGLEVHENTHVHFDDVLVARK